jgi:hypothetical protein
MSTCGYVGHCPVTAVVNLASSLHDAAPVVHQQFGCLPRGCPLMTWKEACHAHLNSQGALSDGCSQDDAPAAPAART